MPLICKGPGFSFPFPMDGLAFRNYYRGHPSNLKLETLQRMEKDKEEAGPEVLTAPT